MKLFSYILCVSFKKEKQGTMLRVIGFRGSDCSEMMVYGL